MVETPTPYSIQITPPGLALTGSLIFTDYELGIARLDLAHNRITPIFQPPEYGTVMDAALSPDRTQIVMAYSPPPAPGQGAYVAAQLYILPLDSSALPTLLLGSSDPSEIFYAPAWSPDGKSIYYGHVLPGNDATGQPEDRFERMDYPGGQAQIVLRNVANPSFSADGKKLVYVEVDPTSLSTALFIADADGANARQLVGPDVFFAEDAAIFTPDGQSIIFSATDPPGSVASSPSWFERLTGGRVAEAHSLPSDLWEISVNGGAIRRLTHLSTFGINPTFSPDGRQIAFTTFGGFYVMNPDGSGLEPIYLQGSAGRLIWIP